MMISYKPGSRTLKAMKSLAEKLEFSVDRSMNEWSEELAEQNRLKQTLNLYDSLIGEDEKFVLMGIMVQAAAELVSSFGFCGAWAGLEQRLIWDFHIHEFTIRNWVRSAGNSIDGSLTIYTEMKALWDRSKQKKTHILFVCTINLMRSATAHKIYEHDLRFEVKSAGTHRSAETVLTKELLDWSDTILVMEDRHRNYIQRMYPEISGTKTILCLEIPDKYDYMHKDLIALLRQEVELSNKKGLI